MSDSSACTQGNSSIQSSHAVSHVHAAHMPWQRLQSRLPVACGAPAKDALVQVSIMICNSLLGVNA